MRIDENRLEHAIDHAELAFWNQFAACYPEIETGDLDSGSVHALTTAMTQAARAWLMANMPEVNGCRECGMPHPGSHYIGCPVVSPEPKPETVVAREDGPPSEGWEGLEWHKGDIFEVCGRFEEDGVAYLELRDGAAVVTALADMFESTEGLTT